MLPAGQSALGGEYAKLQEATLFNVEELWVMHMRQKSYTLQEPKACTAVTLCYPSRALAEPTLHPQYHAVRRAAGAAVMAHNAIIHGLQGSTYNDKTLGLVD